MHIFWCIFCSDLYGEFVKLDQTRMRVDESWQARVCMSVSTTRHCSVKRAVRVAWESFFFFRFPCFCSLLPRFLFLRFLTLVNLLTVRVITPIVTCRWYVIIFSFFLPLLMGNNLQIAGLLLHLSTTLVQLSWRSNEPNEPQIWWQLMRDDESWRWNEPNLSWTL